MRSWCVVLFCLLIPIASAVPASFSDQGVGATLNGITVASAELRITLWDDPTSNDGTHLLLNQTFPGAIVNGTWNVQLDEVALEFGRKYYKDYAIDGHDLDFGSDERLDFYSSLGLINNQSLVNGSAVGGWTSNGTTTSTTLDMVVNGNASVNGSLNIIGTAPYNSKYLNVDLTNVTAPIETMYGSYYSGHFSIAGSGNNESSIVAVRGTATKDSGPYSHGAVMGVQGKATLNSGLTTDTLNAIVGETQNMGGSVNQAYGTFSQVLSYTSTSSIASGFGVYSDVNAIVSGNITNAYALYAKVRSSSGGLISNAYGLYIEPVTSGQSKSYAIYSAGGANYFAGNVSIGRMTATQKLDVNGSGNFSGVNAQVWVNGSVVCTAANGLCAGGGSGWTSNGTTTSTMQKIGIGTATPQSSFEINGSGSGNYAGFPSLVNVRITNHLNWGLTYQNDAWGANNGFGWFLNNAGRLIFASWNGSKYYEPLSLDATSGYVAIGEYFTPNAQLHIQSRNSTIKPLIVQGRAGQSTNLQEWQNSSGAALAYVNASGSLFVENGSGVCTAANGLCAGGSADGTGGWTNTSAMTTTSLIVNTTSNIYAEELYLGAAGYGSIHPKYGRLFIKRDVGQIFPASLAFQDLANSSTAIAFSYTTGNSEATSELSMINSGGSVIETFRGTGEVGIGTRTPTQKLDVNGSVNVSGVSAKLYVPEICLNGDCQTSWPGSVNITGMSDWQLAANDGQGAASVTNGTVVNINGGAGVTVTRSGTTLEINSTTPYQSGAAGWTNTSTTTSTDLVLHLTPQATPGGGSEGDIFYSNTLHKPCYFNSTDWVTFDGLATC